MFFTETLGFLAGRFLFLTVGSRGDNRWRVRRAPAVGGGTTVGVSNASAAETLASYPLLFMLGRRQAGHFPLAALPRRLARVSFGQSGAFLKRKNPQLGSLVLRSRLCTAGPFLKRHRFRKESDSMAESPNSQSRRHLVVSACGAVRGRKAHRHVDGGQLRGLHAGAAGRCTTWPTSCACKAGWCWPIPCRRTWSTSMCSAWWCAKTSACRWPSRSYATCASRSTS